MGSESNSTTTSTSSPSSTGKRSRDPEDEVYLDNLRSHKRYLSEIMAIYRGNFICADNGFQLKWINCRRSTFREPHGIAGQYSPMSEDSDDSRFCEAHIHNCLSQSDSLPTRPISPHRYQRPLSGFSSAPSTSSYPSHNCSVSGSPPRQRGSDSEGRFPSSPSDICHSADLRRAALLRSVQMRTQPPGMPSFEQEPVEEQPCSYIKSLVDEREYQIECSSLPMSEPEFSQEKSCRVLNLNMKAQESRG